MADGYNGRTVKIYIGGIGTAAATLATETQAGAQSKTLTRNRSEIDVTNDSSDGWREVLHTPGMRSVDLSISGVMRSDAYKTLLDRFYDEANTDNYSLRIDHGDDSGGSGNIVRESGKFFLQSLETGAEHEGMVTFSATFISSGEVEVTTTSNP